MGECRAGLNAGALIQDLHCVPLLSLAPLIRSRPERATWRGGRGGGDLREREQFTVNNQFQLSITSRLNLARSEFDML